MYIHVYTRRHTHMYLNMYIYICIYMYMYIFIYINKHMTIHKDILHFSEFGLPCKHTHIHTKTHSCTHTCTYTLISTHTHTHTHMHTCIHMSMYINVLHCWIYLYIHIYLIYASLICISSARPYESCKIFKDRPRRNAFSKLVHRQCKLFPPDRFCQVEIQNTIGLSNKSSTA